MPTIPIIQRGFSLNKKVNCIFNQLDFNSGKVSDIFHAEIIA